MHVQNEIPSNFSCAAVGPCFCVRWRTEALEFAHEQMHSNVEYLNSLNSPDSNQAYF